MKVLVRIWGRICVLEAIEEYQVQKKHGLLYFLKEILWLLLDNRLLWDEEKKK